MKLNLKIYYLIVLIVICFGCCEDYEFIERQSKRKTIVRPELSNIINPHLLSDWEACTTISLNTLGSNGLSKSVAAPWSSLVPTMLDSDFRNDIKKNDGWMMLFHTMCTPGENEHLAYMCFYNFLTGYIKVFYYSEVFDTGTSTKWQISSGTGKPISIFSDSEHFTVPLDGSGFYTISAIDVDNMILNQKKSGLCEGWNGFKFRVGSYYPQISDEDIIFSGLNTMITSIKMNGKAIYDTTGKITTVNSESNSFINGSIPSAILESVGASAKQVVDSFARKNLNIKLLGINVAEIAAKAAVGDYASALKSGLGLVMKGIIKSEPSVSESEVNLKSRGDLTFEGTLETDLNSRIIPLSFNLNNILKGKSGQKNIAHNTAKNIGLGLWNLSNRPTIYYDRYTRFHIVSPIEDYDRETIDFHGLCEHPNLKIADVNVVINPLLLPYVKSYSVTTGIVDVKGGNRFIEKQGKLDLGINNLNKIDVTGINPDLNMFGIGPQETSLYGMVEIGGNKTVNNNTKYYIDWGTNVTGNCTAAVTLTMNIEYNGKQWSVTESRLYDVVYKPSTSIREQYVNNPPETYLLNGSDKYYGFEIFVNF